MEGLIRLYAAAALAVVGLGVGLLSGVFGIGGGVVAVPALGLLLGLDQHVAQGSSLLMIVPTVALGAWRYARQGSVRWGAAAWIGLSAVAFSLGGAHLALRLPAQSLRALFAAFLLFLAWRTATGRGRPTAPGAGGRPLAGAWWRQLGIGAAVGTLAGMLGVGGGTIAIPGLILLCGFTAQEAQGTSLASLVASAAAGAAGYASQGQVDYLAAGCLFAGAAVTVPVGVALAHRLPERRLRAAFAVFVAVVALIELWNAIRP